MAITRPTPVELSKGTAKTMGRTWTDSSTSTQGLPTGGTAPTRVQILGAGSIYGLAYAVNDLNDFWTQLPHSPEPDSDLRLHVHFMFPSQPEAGRTVRFELYFTLAGVNDAFAAESGPHYGEYTIQASDSQIHRVQALVTGVLPAAPHSAWVHGRIRRVASTGTESDVSPIIGFVDGHF